MQGKFSAYDICADGIYYEVKSDRKAHATNNICIEYECSQKPSGINVTQADFYVYFIITNIGIFIGCYYNMIYYYLYLLYVIYCF
jgi:hypothetical protein